jgi:histidinol-phosphatase (PHP family)
VIVDYHLHLRTEDDEPWHAVEAVERYVEAARAAGVDEIGVTEHVFGFREAEHLFADVGGVVECSGLELDAYADAVLEAKRRGLPVKLALEVDWLGERAAELDRILAPYPWDYLLVSVHWIDGAAVDQQPGLWADRAVEDVWRLYFAELGAAARSGLFDVVAHPDLVKLFGTTIPPELAAELYRAAAADFAVADVAVEVSTAGLQKPTAALYPSAELLAAAAALDVPVTLASDAHSAREVGRDLELAVAGARAAGYDTISVFDGRRRTQEPLG